MFSSTLHCALQSNDGFHPSMDFTPYMHFPGKKCVTFTANQCCFLGERKEASAEEEMAVQMQKANGGLFSSVFSFFPYKVTNISMW